MSSVPKLLRLPCTDLRDALCVGHEPTANRLPNVTDREVENGTIEADLGTNRGESLYVLVVEA